MDIQWIEIETPNFVTITGTLNGYSMSIKLTRFDTSYGYDHKEAARRQIERALQGRFAWGQAIPVGPADQPHHPLSQYSYDYPPDYRIPTSEWKRLAQEVAGNYLKRNCPSAEDMAAFNELDQEGD